MIIFVLLNVAIVILAVSFDLYRQRFKQLKFSTILVSITINAILNLFLIGKYDFISIYTVIFFLIWTLLQIYINHKIKPYFVIDQKFISIIFAIVISLSTIIAFISSNQSIYMSIPYLAPAVFIIGAIILFIGTFKSYEINEVPLIKRFRLPVLIGTIIIILSFIVIMMLTPFWYIFLIIYLLFLAFIIWQKILI